MKFILLVVVKKKNLFSVPLHSSRLGCFIVHEVSTVCKKWPFSSFKFKAFLIPIENDGMSSFAVFPLSENKTNY